MGVSHWTINCQSTGTINSVKMGSLIILVLVRKLQGFSCFCLHRAVIKSAQDHIQVSKNYYILKLVCVHKCVHTHETECMCSSEENMWESLFSFHCGHPDYQTQVCLQDWL